MDLQRCVIATVVLLTVAGAVAVLAKYALTTTTASSSPLRYPYTRVTAIKAIERCIAQGAWAANCQFMGTYPLYDHDQPFDPYGWHQTNVQCIRGIFVDSHHSEDYPARGSTIEHGIVYLQSLLTYLEALPDPPQSSGTTAVVNPPSFVRKHT